jgi:hypothetical protein
MTRTSCNCVAIVCLLSALAGKLGAALPAAPTAAAATAPETSAAPATTPTGLYVTPSLALVLERIENWPNGLVAVFVEYGPDGNKFYRYLKEGRSSAWVSKSGLESVKVLAFDGDHVRVSRSPSDVGERRSSVVVEPRVVDVKIGFDLEGRPAPPPPAPPLNPALLTLGVEELFAKCQAATGTDYAQAKAVMVSRPKESDALAGRMLDNKDSPWQQRALAQALAEEIANPKGYAAARMELIRVAYVLRTVPSTGQGGVRTWDHPGLRDPREVYRTDSESLYKLLATYPGLKGEIILKSTADHLFPLVAEAASENRRLQTEEYLKAWEADQVGPRTMGTNLQPPFLTPAMFLKQAQPNDPALMLRYVRSEAALACAHKPTTDTRSLFSTLDPKEYTGVLRECDRILQEAARSQPATPRPPPPQVRQDE